MKITERRAFLILVIMSVIHGMIHTYSIFLSPLNEEMRRFFQADTVSAITSFKTTYLIIYALSNLLFGVLTNRISARLTLTIGMTVNGIAIAAFGLIPPDQIGLMHLLWALAALGGGTYHPVANVLITRLYPIRKGWALGITGIGSGAGFAFGPVFTGLLTGLLGFSWQEVAFTFGLAGLVAALSVLIAVRDLPSASAAAVPVPAPSAAAEPAGPAAPLRTSVASRPPIPGTAMGLFMFFIVTAVATREIAMWSAIDVADFYLTASRGMTGRTAWYLFLMYIPAMIIQPLAGTLSDTLGRRTLAVAAFGIHSLSFFLIIWLPGGLLFLPFLIMGVGQNASVPVVEALVGDVTTPRNRGFYYGIYVTSVMGLGALGPLLSGLLIDGLGGTREAYRICLTILGILPLIGAFMMLFTDRVLGALKIVPHRE